MKFELTKANWESYFGNNHNKITYPDVVAGGSVSFKRHFGKPLSQELWEDLVHRFVINGLCIYRPNDSQWCLGWGQGHCIIYLDDKDCVENIIVTPYNVSIKKEH